MRVPFLSVPLVAAAVLASGLDETELQPVLGEPPLGLPLELVEPEGNEFSLARWELGRRLFFDGDLSRDGTVSCSSCHKPEHGFADDAALSRGVDGQLSLRNAPSLLNRGFGERFMWDGRMATLESQALEPIENPREMALGVEAALERLRADASYAAAFQEAYPGGVTRDNLARALAQFVRHLALGDSPVDRFRSSAHKDPLSADERVGLWVFESKGRCWRCHGGPNFTDEGFHNTGVGVRDGAAEPGRGAITGDAADRGRFKTPTLRGVAHSAPYMHDGSLATLADVVEFYRTGGGPNPDLDPLIEPIELSEREAAGLVSLLEALSRRAAPAADAESDSEGGAR